ncbi:claudin-10-like [Archocentrus centrarchus]|uniref:claudin-10-like n=1 Tax=Archocentrus centrarchus TaxID=63155 RepID=UPI0011EA2C3C|nr:claudin-10-like [Archocentrus centrarchus]
MRYRTVVMYLEIGCFVCCLCGWILVSSTLPTEYWSLSEVGSKVLTTSNYYSNLWMDCVSDTTGVSDCNYYDSLLTLPAFLQACRALAVCAVITGFFGSVLTLIGMKCTKIGGTDIINTRVTFSGAVTYLASGGCGIITYSWWANRVINEFKDPNFKAQKFELGAAIFIGWGGSVLLICAGAVLAYLSGKEILSSRSRRPISSTVRMRGTDAPPPTTSKETLVPPLNGRTTRATNLTRDSLV